VSEAPSLEDLLGAELACPCASPYDSAAVRWLLGGELHPGGDRLTRRLARLAGVRRGWRVLDVASGPGGTARVLAAELAAEVVGVDRSPQSVAAARAEADAAGLGERVRFVEGNAETLPVASGAFDAVVCECALCLFPDKPKALAEIRRALRPGGVLAVADVTAELDDLPASLRGAVARVACIGEALSEDGYRALLRNAGFELAAAESHDGALAALAERVEARLRVARMLRPAAGFAELIGEANELVREAKQAIARGSLGYALFIARRAASRPAPRRGGDTSQAGALREGQA
jgi:ubiquinone/menaquinone biosynthesis C-methylase UbiE